MSAFLALQRVLPFGFGGRRALLLIERNLLGVQDLGHDMGSLRKMFDLFEQKTHLMRLLDTSSRADGVRIFIGGESQVVPFEELSVVSSPYEVDGRVVGTGRAVELEPDDKFERDGVDLGAPHRPAHQHPEG